MDYGFTHKETVYTPNGTKGISTAESEARNAAIEAQELGWWGNMPTRHLAYYNIERSIVTTWRGTVLGTITSKRIYHHNFGGRFIALTVQGTNGGTYHGRASYDNGDCIRLRLSG